MAFPTGTRDRDFAAMFQAHHAQVLAYALRRTATPADAEDVAAETFVVAWRRRDSIPTDALPWLYGVARRVLANQRRSTMRRLRLVARWRPEPAPVMAGESDGPAQAALARLRPDDQELLRLVAWEELSHAQIATVLGVSVNAVAIRLHRARRRFENEFRRLHSDVKGSADDRTSGWVKGTLSRRIPEETR